MSDKEILSPDQKALFATDRYEHLVGVLDDLVPASRELADAIRDLIRAEIDRMIATGKVYP